MKRQERDAQNLQRRLEVVRLPVTTLRIHGYLKPSAAVDEWSREACTVGIGPGHVAVAVWPSRTMPTRKLTTTHYGGSDIATSTVIDSAIDPTFIQPLPDSRFLLASARSRAGRAHNAEIWNSDGSLHHTGQLGDAIEQLLTTPSGRIWAGYFDEAMGGAGPQSHGLVRYTPELDVEWLYPLDAGLPDIFDVYALNVAGENAHCCAYTKWNLVSVHADRATDRGHVPLRGAGNLLINGDTAVLIGGYAAEYDLITPLRTTRLGVEHAGPPRRLVLPDGLEVRDARYTCRGADLHVIIRGIWYRTTIDDMV